MRFGLFYELQLPKPWDAASEQRLLNQAIEQVQLADSLGIDYAWATEHHFLEEYSHSSASEVLLTALAAKTENIRVGFGIRQVIPAYNHPARSAEAIGMLDLISGGRVEFGFGESATATELGGFNVRVEDKRELAMEAAEQIANMMVMDPYPGFVGKGFEMPVRTVVPKPVQKPHPPMWMACTNRATIEVAARNGVGALAFSFLDVEEAKHWADIYYSIIKSEECVPIGHAVNPSIAMVTAFSLSEDRDTAIERGVDGFRFFNWAMKTLVTEENKPGRADLWTRYIAQAKERKLDRQVPGIGTPEEFYEVISEYDKVGVDQIIFLQQGGKNQHEDICASLQLFADKVLPRFTEGREQREKEKLAELAPYIEAALARKRAMTPLADDEIPLVQPFVRPPAPAPQAG
jgi:alkanesulfonate monooxygenase SsuD/methylene tetrahydromethanopterin reductase-like flavin-dependent oxidoreductase (luciferase family)